MPQPGTRPTPGFGVGQSTTPSRANVPPATMPAPIPSRPLPPPGAPFGLIPTSPPLTPDATDHPAAPHELQAKPRRRASHATAADAPKPARGAASEYDVECPSVDDVEPPQRNNMFVIGLSMAVMAGAGLLFMSMFTGRPAHRNAEISTADAGSTAVQELPVGTSATTTLAQADEGAEQGPGSPKTSTTTAVSKAAASPTRLAQPSAQTPSSRSVNGESIAVGPYGPLRVSIAMDGSRILSISVPTYPKGPTSSDINAKAVPQLIRQAMALQSAGVDGVSGATLTSVAFRQSLQHAINRARA